MKLLRNQALLYNRPSFLFYCNSVAVFLFSVWCSQLPRWDVRLCTSLTKLDYAGPGKQSEQGSCSAYPGGTITSCVCSSSLNLQPTGFTKKYTPLRTNLLRRKMSRKEWKQQNHHIVPTSLKTLLMPATKRGPGIIHGVNLNSAPSCLTFPSHYPTCPFTEWWLSTGKSPFIPLRSLSYLQNNERSPKCPHRRCSKQHTAWPKAELSSLLLTTSSWVNGADPSINISTLCMYVEQKAPTGQIPNPPRNEDRGLSPLTRS